MVVQFFVTKSVPNLLSDLEKGLAGTYCVMLHNHTQAKIISKKKWIIPWNMFPNIRALLLYSCSNDL